MVKKAVSKRINKVFFPNVNISFFFNGISKDSEKNDFLKIKSTTSLSKTELRTFLFDGYLKKTNKVHSKIERSKKKNRGNGVYKQKKVFWVNY